MRLVDEQQNLGISDEAIAKRAYEIWQERGCQEDDGAENWQLAQTQLLAEARRRQPPILRLLNRLRNRAAL